LARLYYQNKPIKALKYAKEELEIAKNKRVQGYVIEYVESRVC